VPLDSNPNSNNENIFINGVKTIFTYIYSFVFINTNIFSYIEKLRAIANAFLSYLYTRAYYKWSNVALLNVKGISVRHGFTDGKSAILLVVYVVVAFLVATILFPIAMQQVTSAVTTSWNGAVSTVYVVLLPILVIIALALHFLGAI
jgi:hypothetical protein